MIKATLKGDNEMNDNKPAEVQAGHKQSSSDTALARRTNATGDYLIGYVVHAPRYHGRTVLVRDLAAACRRERTWDRLARRWYGSGAGYDAPTASIRRRPDGTCYVIAGGRDQGEPGTGAIPAVGTGGQSAVDMTIEWLRNRPQRWLLQHGIMLA